MKKRNRMGGRRSSSRPKPLNIFAARNPRKRKPFSFEKLEDRFAFTATQTDLQSSSVSSDTLEGQAVLLQREIEWALLQAASMPADLQPQYALMALPNDPMFGQQWHLINVGQGVGNPDLQNLAGIPGEDINVIGVWQGTGLENSYTGAGIKVAVFDSGVQLFHPDLAGNIHPTLRFNATNGTNNASPSLTDPTGYHGTAVAGLIGALANNEIGGTGVAPDVILVPIRRDFTNFFEEEAAFQFVNRFDLDITNNSWGPNHSTSRTATPLSATELEILRNSVRFGRDGKGIIHVFASGNDAGPAYNGDPPGSPGFANVGNYDSSSYNAWVNSRYTIGVTGVDHDGLYINKDNSFTSYPVGGPSVLIAAPTGSNGFLSIGTDTGYGSGLWTTDLIGDFGNNAAPDETGYDPDFDPWEDTSYTSRFNGTSGAAPIVTGVIALMLEANPNLTYRDVQEILVRTARQNAQFEFPVLPGVATQNDLPPQNSWQINQIQPFRNPDSFFDPNFSNANEAMQDPLTDPNKNGPYFDSRTNFQILNRLSKLGPDTNDEARQFWSTYEPQPAMFTNGAGYTVSQGYGKYGEQIGYAHGVIDAQMAVDFAEQWKSLGNVPEELTFSTSVISPGQGFSWPILAGSRVNPPPNGNSMVVPGGLSFPDTPGDGGYIAYWNQYFTDNPFQDYTGPSDLSRGLSYVDFAVPPAQSMDIEWVEIKLDISGDANAFDFLRIMLTSPEGAQSELNNFYLQPSFAGVYSLQEGSMPVRPNDPLGTITDGRLVWTFSTNRHWGESSNSAVIIDPLTGEPLEVDVSDGNFPNPTTDRVPVFRNWELHIENYSSSGFSVQGLEVIWHGKAIEGGELDENYAAYGIMKAQRVQGFVGIDSGGPTGVGRGDEKFNYNRYIQTMADPDGAPDTVRVSDLTRQLDFTDVNGNHVYDDGIDVINQEPFAANVLVEAYRVYDGIAESSPTRSFLTGADGNYYFDFDVQGDIAEGTNPNSVHFGKTFDYYEIRINEDHYNDQHTTPLETLEDILTPASAPLGLNYLPHYKQVWHITPDWFYAPDRDIPVDDTGDLIADRPGEILYDPLTGAPVPYTDNGPRIPMAVKNINFLLKEQEAPQQVVITGTAYIDFNGNGTYEANVDAPAPGVRIYYDSIANGTFNSGEESAITGPDGKYTFTIHTTNQALAQFTIGVDPNFGQPTAWQSTQPGGLLKTILAKPGDPASIANFFLAPPSNGLPGSGENGNLIGWVFNDLDLDGNRDPAELGVAGIRVFVDSNENGVWDNNGDAIVDPGEEIGVLTNDNGSYFLSNVPGGTHRVMIVTDGTVYQNTVPANGVRTVVLVDGATKQNILFGVKNLANRDWGDLGPSFHTTSATNGPSHVVYSHFRLGNNISGEVNGVPSAGANTDTNDDGVLVGGGILQPGENEITVTVFGVGGSLTGWIDWDKSGTFSESERLVWTWTDEFGTHTANEADLAPGTHVLKITQGVVPDGPIAARFRWGEAGLSFDGPADIGEVEDYMLESSSVEVVGGDYTNDGYVDAADYVLWRHNMNTGAPLQNDTTPGSVGEQDYNTWRWNLGDQYGGGSGEGAGGGSGESLVDGGSEQPQSNSLVGDDGPAVVGPQGGPSANTHSTPVAESDGPLTLNSLLVATLRSDASASVGFTSSTFVANVGKASVAEDSAATSLLLDQALAELSDDGDDEAPIADRFKADEEGPDDGVLAAVFEGQDNWWSL